MEENKIDKKNTAENIEEELFDLLLEEERPTYQGKLKSFENYAARKKAQAHRMSEEHIHQLYIGYTLILEKLNSSNSKHKIK